MTEEIRRAVIQAVAERFSLPVYGQRVPQGAKKPCFTVELLETEQKPLLGGRVARRTGLAVTYYCGEEEATAERAAVLEGLYDALCIIGTTERFAASSMKEEGTETGIRFTAVYEYHAMRTADAAEKMERLKYNGREASGYEEKDDIQQGAAE